MCVPGLLGGVYTPLTVIVPEADDPPTVPSTDQTIGGVPPLVVNRCVWVRVSAAALGLTLSPPPAAPRKATICMTQAPPSKTAVAL